MRFYFTLVLVCLFLVSNARGQSKERLSFEALPNLPDEIGLAGPIVGNDKHGAIIVCGGANFSTPDDPKLWELPKKYCDKIYLYSKTGRPTYQWLDVDVNLSTPVAYSASISLPFGIIVLGGEDSNGPTNRVFGIAMERMSKAESGYGIKEVAVFPDLPLPCTGCGAARIGNFIYVVGGQVQLEDGRRVASRFVWRLDVSELQEQPFYDEKPIEAEWEVVASWPDSAPARMFPLVAAQHDGFAERLYVFGGRDFKSGLAPSAETLEFGSDGWSFDPNAYNPDLFDEQSGVYTGESPWKEIASSPVPLTAGTCVPVGPAHLVVLGYATGEILAQQIASGIPMERFDHPGFPRKAYAYHTITDTWVELGQIPSNQVTTPAISIGNDIYLMSGEVRPRVRTRNCWRIQVLPQVAVFGTANTVVLCLYLLAMFAVGVYFMTRNRSTDDFFRGGKSIPWWAAGCSIFATMLSSITYMAVPAKAFAQDWVYWVGNMMILAVAPIAIYFALPFFRHIDATSAYEYLEKRFNQAARMIGSGSFTLFHLFRIAVVLALAAMALASVTPLSSAQCVILMGLLSIAYCTLGGIEAVIWTDTIQTFVLLGGAILVAGFAYFGAETGSYSAALDANKLHMINWEFGFDSYTLMAIWVVVIGGLGQNFASYTADQAVVQRYMTTPDIKMARRSIWLNGWLAIPASGVFFAMGTALWMFYRSNPEKLDPTIASDRIMPHFISHELPAGLAGLVVAGIFAAAQSTVSTSMNSGATTMVTDFIRPLGISRSEKSSLIWARLATLVMGLLGTWIGLIFIDPQIKSLWDQFIGFLGMFLGVLAGLFALGATTRRANGKGSLMGALIAITLMMLIVLAANEKAILGVDIKALFDRMGIELYRINGYLYAVVGIVVCYVAGYIASFCFRSDSKPLAGLTLWDRT